MFDPVEPTRSNAGKRPEATIVRSRATNQTPADRARSTAIERLPISPTIQTAGNLRLPRQLLSEPSLDLQRAAIDKAILRVPV